MTPTYYISIDAESNYLSQYLNPYMPTMIIYGINATYKWRTDLIHYSVGHKVTQRVLPWDQLLDEQLPSSNQVEYKILG